MGAVTRPFLSPERLYSPPARLRTWSVALVALIALSGTFSAIAAVRMGSATDSIRDSTGPLLIGSQELIASLAEADASNTSVFLAGETGDRQSRLAYETAMDRAARQIERLAARTPIEDTDDHERLEAIGGDLITYAASVEGTLDGVGDDVAELARAIDFVGGDGGMIDNAAAVSETATARLDGDISAGLIPTGIAVVLLIITVIGLVIAQRSLAARTRRRFNLGLLFSTVLVIALGVWLLLAAAGRAVDLQSARDDGYQAIETTAEIQRVGFEFKTRDAAARVGAQSFGDGARRELASQVTDQIDGLLAASDNEREAAAAQSLRTRWDRFVLGDGTTTDFTGFTTSLEAALLENRDQFDAAVESASRRSAWLFIGSILLALAASAAALAGYQPRINEYY